MSKPTTSARETIAAWLRDQGHLAEIQFHDDRFADVLFRTRGFKLMVRVDESEPRFLYITLKTGVPEDVTDELLARRVAALAQSRTKLLKVDIGWEARSLVLAAEQLVSEAGGPSIFWNTVSILVESFFTILRLFNEEIGRAAAVGFTEQLEAELARGGAPRGTEDSR